LVILIACELARGIAMRRWTAGVIAVAAAGAIASNFGALRDAGRIVRADGQRTTAVLGAVDIGRPLVRPGYYIQGIPGWPLVVVPATAYFAAARAVAVPTATPAQIAAEPEPVRQAADTELIHIHSPSLIPARPGLRLGAPPVVDLDGGGTTNERGGCVAFVAERFTSSGSVSPFLSVAVPPAGLVVEVSGGSATVGLRRFAYSFQTLGTVAPGGTETLVMTPDLSQRPWHMVLRPAGRALVCGLR
jgi:hypothetical protein